MVTALSVVYVGSFFGDYCYVYYQFYFKSFDVEFNQFMIESIAIMALNCITVK